MKLSMDLIAAMARYYSHRHKQKFNNTGWDKQKDLNSINKVAAKHNFGVCAVAGTFWFSRNNKTYEYNESNYTD